jgi:arabinogalactan oligomer / maltooligosaccharide transport system substrate-binding protein
VQKKEESLMMSRQQNALLSLCIIIGLVLGACAPQQSAGAPRITKAVTLTVWHGRTDPNELALLNGTIDTFQKANPKAKVDVLAVPFDQLKNKFTTEASTGGGPDLLIGPKDWIGELTNAKLVA